MTIIEVDGVNSEPLLVDSVQIFAAQRYSVVVNANQAVGNYWIRANPNLGNTGFDGGINSAILRYVGAADADPTSTQGTSTKPLIETNLHPLENPGAVSITSAFCHNAPLTSGSSLANLPRAASISL